MSDFQTRLNVVLNHLRNSGFSHDAAWLAAEIEKLTAKPEKKAKRGE